MSRASPQVRAMWHDIAWVRCRDNDCEEVPCYEPNRARRGLGPEPSRSGRPFLKCQHDRSDCGNASHRRCPPGTPDRRQGKNGGSPCAAAALDVMRFGCWLGSFRHSKARHHSACCASPTLRVGCRLQVMGIRPAP